MVHLIIATHKEPRLLRCTISSILGQTSSDWELIVIDNSPDHYFKQWLNSHDDLVGSYIDKIKIKEIEHGLGTPGKYKLMGVDMIDEGEDDFIFIMDHDDLIMPTLVENVLDIKEKYPWCEMISSYYGSLFVGSNDDMKTFYVTGVNQPTLGGTEVGVMEEVWTGDFHYRWPAGGPVIYGNTHDYLPILHPKIVRKRAITEHRFILNTTTNIDDTYVFEICNIALPEVYIDDIQYWFMCYASFNPDGTWQSLNTSCWNTPAGTNNHDEDADAKKALCTMLDKYQFRKNRVHYIPKKQYFKSC